MTKMTKITKKTFDDFKFGNSYFSFSGLSSLIEYTTCSTYKTSTLKRRFNLLKIKEQKKVIKLLEIALSNISKIDEIISNRAELEKDLWK